MATNIVKVNLESPRTVDSIAALEALNVSRQTGVVYLDAGGRSGWFKWDSSPLSTEVSNDTAQGIYVAPSSDATGASGAWVRDYNNALNVEWFGAVGNGTTDDTTAIQNAVDFGGAVYFPENTYRVVGSVNLQANQVVFSENATVFCDPSSSYLGAFNMASASVVDGIIFQGNNTQTGVASQNSLGQVGAAVRGVNIANAKIINCSFKNFILDNIDEAVVGFNRCRDLLIHENYFDSTSSRGTDINLAYDVANSIISNNFSLSATDKFCYISTVNVTGDFPGTEIAKTNHHLITNNIYLKGNLSTTPGGRHGIIVHYNGGSSYAVISNNILANGTRHGIYLRGGNTAGVQTGPTIVSNNIIRYFGGGENQTSYWGYNSGIKVESVEPLIVTGNLIEKCGYTTDGSATAIKSSGISSIRPIRNAIISDNQITDIQGPGICLSPTVPADVGTYVLDKVSISNNIVKNTVDGGIVYSTQGGTGPNTTRGLKIVDNTVEITQDNIAAIALNLANNSSDPKGTLVVNNSLYGASNGTTYGIVFTPSVNSYGIIEGNVIENFTQGLSFGVPNLTGRGSLTSYTGHRRIGTNILVRSNRFVDCSTSVFVQNTATGILSFICPSNSFISSSVPNRNINFFNRFVLGELNAFDSSNNRTVKLYMNAAPTTGSQQYYVGDMIQNIDPVSSGTIGWVCTTSGTPGTWKTFGTIS